MAEKQAPNPRPRLKMKLTKKPKPKPVVRTFVQTTVSPDKNDQLDLENWKWIGDFEGVLINHHNYCSNYGKRKGNPPCCKDLTPEAAVEFQLRDYDEEDDKAIIVSNKTTQINIGRLHKDTTSWLRVLLDKQQIRVEGVLPADLGDASVIKECSVVLSLTANTSKIPSYVSSTSSSSSRHTSTSSTSSTSTANEVLTSWSFIKEHLNDEKGTFWKSLHLRKPDQLFRTEVEKLISA